MADRCGSYEFTSLVVFLLLAHWNQIQRVSNFFGIRTAGRSETRKSYLTNLMCIIPLVYNLLRLSDRFWSARDSI